MEPVKICLEKTDEEIAKLIAQDQSFFVYLMQRYEEKLLRYIIRISGVSPEDAQDLLQEVYLKVYRNINDFDASLKFSSWIYRITHNHVISDFRRRKVRPQSIISEGNDLVLQNIVSDFSVEADLNKEYTKIALMKIINELDPKYQDVLVLKFFDEKDYQEISDILKKPVGTIGTLISRAKKQLKIAIKKNNPTFYE